MRRGTLLNPIDVYTPCPQGSMDRAYQLFAAGVYRLARRDCMFHSIMIAAAGDFGRLAIRDGKLRPLWRQPSTFTGSFCLDAFAEGGLIVEAHLNAQPFLTISWKEPDSEVV